MNSIGRNWLVNVGLPTLVFLIWVGVLYQKADVLDKLNHRPTGEHFWAQTDRASMALSYHTDEASFWLPRCHKARKGEEGITAGEFPIIPYTVSKMYDAWGVDEVYHRGFVLFLSLLGFLLSYLLIAKLLNSYWWASLVASLWLASPNLIFYSFSFLPDLPALTFAVLALYVLKRSSNGPTPSAILLFSFFAAISGLLKLTGIVVAFSAAAGIMAFDLDNVKQNLKYWVIALIIPVVMVGSWVIYARHLLHVYKVFTFLLEPLPPKTWQEFTTGTTDLVNLRQMYYAVGFWWFLIPAIVLAAVFQLKAQKPLLAGATLMFFGFAAMFIVLFEKSPYHMYYWLPFQLMVLLLLAWVFKVFDVRIRTSWIRGAVYVLGFVLVNYCSIHVHKNIKNRWGINLEAYQPYYNLEPKLESLGINLQDRVLSYPDPTPNGTLYLMNRKGMTVSESSSNREVISAIEQCDYAILADVQLADNPAYKEYFYRQLGTENGLTIYSLNAFKRTNR